MSVVAYGQRCWLAIGLGVLLAFLAPAAHALEATITAEYRGGANSTFVNTTPVAGYCVVWPRSCLDLKLIDMGISYVKEVTKGGPRDRFYVKTPGRRTVDVYNESTGEPHSLQFEISGIGGLVSGPGAGWDNPVYSVDLQGPCTRKGGSNSPGRGVLYLWTIQAPGSGATCDSIYVKAQPDYRQLVTVSGTGIAYNLTTPQPYRMKPGIYRGSTTYTIGPGGDFDFGDAVTEQNSNSLTVNFVLDVQHLFLLSFPPGSDRAVLEPEGGWTAWLNHGRVPQRLYRDLPMHVWSTGPLKVYKLCDYEMGDRCGIRNEKNEGAPVHVLLTLPDGIRYRGGPVQRLNIPTGRASAVQFESMMPTINRPGQLHFEIRRDDVVPMFNRPGMTYSGKVTIVFDAEI